MEIGAGFLDPELPTKYAAIQKELAQEKSQSSSLQKSLTESELNCKEQKSKIVEQAKQIRQFDSEVESLLFRNNQLSKRVEVLQEELQSLLTSKKSKRPTTPQSNPSSRSSSTTSLPNSLAIESSSVEAYATDLANKISENERLHNEIFDLTSKKRLQAVEFDEKVSSLQSEYDSARKDKEEHHILFTQQIQELESKQMIMSTTFEQKSQENKALVLLIAELKESSSKLESFSRTNTEQHAQLISERLPFIDDEITEFNNYNIPQFDYTLQSNFTQVFKQIANIFITYTTQTSLFHTYLESTLINVRCDPDSRLNVIQITLIAKLHKTKFFLKPIENCLQLILQAIDKTNTTISRKIFSDLNSNFRHFVNYIRIIAKFHTLFLEEESKDITLKLELRQCSKKLGVLIASFPIPLEKILTILNVLSQDVLIPSDAFTRLIENLQVNFLQLSVKTKDIALCYTNKIQLVENSSLTTVNASLSADNQCIMTSLASLINTTEKLMHYFTESMSVLTSYGKLALKSYSMSRNSCETELLRERSTQYMKKFDGTPAQSLLYPVTLSLSNQVFTYLPDKNHDSLTPQPRDFLLTQLQSTQNNLSQIERENENLKIELELLKLPQKHKHKEHVTIHNDVDNSTTSSSTDLINLNDSNSAIDNTDAPFLDSRSNSSAEIAATSLMNDENEGKTESSSVVSEEREKLIREFYTQKVTQMNEEVQNCDSKSSYFYNEIKSISKHLTHLQHLRKKDAKLMQAGSTKITELQSDLETTQKSYERQLNVMSETMLSLNEQLSQRQDEVERLTSDISVKKKGNKKL